MDLTTPSENEDDHAFLEPVPVNAWSGLALGDAIGVASLVLALAAVAIAVSGVLLVYVIDSGVADHSDFRDSNGENDIVTRTNVACGTSWECQLVDPTTYPVVGCYAHATHVAGIIGARANNDKTTAGVYAGVQMVSVAITSRTGNVSGNCGDSPGPPNNIVDPNSVLNSRVAMPWTSFIGIRPTTMHWCQSSISRLTPAQWAGCRVTARTFQRPTMTRYEN